MGTDLQLRNGKPLRFVFGEVCDPLPDFSAWGRMGSAGVEWGRNRGEGRGGRKLKEVAIVAELAGIDK
jgi:hypothetical protein